MNRLSLILTAAAGMIDVVGFIELGGFYTSFMSGNTTQLGAGLLNMGPALLLPIGLIVMFTVRTFIIVPNSGLLDQWVAELAKFFSGIPEAARPTIGKYGGGKKEIADMQGDRNKQNAALIAAAERVKRAEGDIGDLARAIDAKQENRMMKIGLMGYGKAGKAVANVLAQVGSGHARALVDGGEQLATEFDDTHVCRTIARASRDVCSGEILQTQRRFDLNLSVADYLRMIEMKTAALFGVAAGMGARLNKVPEHVEAALHSYGMKLGTVYQIYDPQAIVTDPVSFFNPGDSVAYLTDFLLDDAAISAKNRVDAGVVSLGLSTTVLPAAIAGANFQVAMFSG